MLYFLIDDALRSVIRLAYVYQHLGYEANLLLNSVFLAFSSLTRLAKIWAYSFCSAIISPHAPTNHIQRSRHTAASLEASA